MAYDVYGIGNALLDIQYDTDEQFLTKHDIPKGLMSYVSHDEQNAIMNALGEDSYRQISPGGSVVKPAYIATSISLRGPTAKPGAV